MVTGLIPVIGIPLPFVSYGGSSLLVNMLMLGIVANIYRTRKNYI
jgi:rod shape determining protein RodA